MEPFESSSSERVVSFFSPIAERSRGNSFRRREYFAATSTPRYLLAACFAISTGVNTLISSFLLCLCVFRSHAPGGRSTLPPVSSIPPLVPCSRLQHRQSQ